jgi:hypothetical protein
MGKRAPRNANISAGAHTKERAEFWRASVRTVQKWKAARPAVPIDDVDGMLRWYAALPSASQAKLTPAFRRRIDEIRAGRERTSGNLFIADQDYADFHRDHGTATAAGGGQEVAALAALKLQRDFAVFKIQRAQARGSIAEVKDATEQLRYISGVIHDEELRAQKLGREIGDILPRAEAERVFRALPYWLLRGVDDLLAELTKRLAAASSSGPLFPEEVRAIIEPVLLSTRVLLPFVRASQVNAGNTLPVWAVTQMRESMAATLESGAVEFARLYATPPAPPTLQLAAGDGI